MVEGTLKSISNISFRIELTLEFSSSQKADPSGHGE